MSAKLTRVEFTEDGNEFDLKPRYERGVLEHKFNELKEGLLKDVLKETNLLNFEQSLKLAANEAAGIAWTTEFPLLVFPGLFAEFALKERAKTERQSRIREKTEMLLETV